MRTPISLSLASVCAGLAMSLFETDLSAAEEREWMSRKGGSVVATLHALRGDEVALVTRESRQITVKLPDLSLADRQYLIEFAGANASIIAEGDPGTPEKDAQIDSSKMVRRLEKLKLGDDDLCSFNVLESPRFWIATAGDVRPQGLAETAERLWHGMAFQHMNFRKDWGNRRMLILAVENRQTWATLGSWVATEISKVNPEAGERMNSMWGQLGATQISVPEEIAKEHNLMRRALILNVTDTERYRRAMGPFQIHTISGALLDQQVGGVSSFADEGYFAVNKGHCYYKEILLGGKSETNQLAQESAGDELTSKSGFQDGRSWARTLRSLVRKGKIKLSLEETLDWKAADLDPEKLVTIYALSYFMQSDAKRLSCYSRMIRRMESSNQVPEAEEIARIFGHESVEQFDADWTTFVTSENFR